MNEAKSIVETIVVIEELWLRKIMWNTNIEQKEATEFYTDNQAAISITNNSFFIGEPSIAMFSIFSRETCLKMEM